MKLHIKEVMRQLAFAEITMLTQPPRNVQTKRAKKKSEIYKKIDID